MHGESSRHPQHISTQAPCAAVRYAVTGGLGFIGLHLVRRLAGQGHNILVVDAREPAGTVAPGAEHVRADVTDPDAMRAALHGTDGVFHLAALVSATESTGRPAEYKRVNVGGTRTVLRAADRASAPVVLASSAAVYGYALGGAHVPVAEDGAGEPASPYGATKLECERLLSAPAGECPDEAPAAVSLRLFNVYGPALCGSASAGVVARFAARIMSGLPPTVFGGGLQVRDFVHVDDVARAFVAAMRLASSYRNVFPASTTRRHLAVNIGTGQGTPILDLAHLMLRTAGTRRKRAGPEFGPAVLGDAAYSVSDPSLAVSALGWRPTVALRDGLRGLLSASC